MNKRFCLVMLIAGFGFGFSFGGGQNCDGQVRVVNRPFMNELGRASVDRWGNQTIEINRRRCSQLGPGMCDFVRAHEQAHLQLGHFHRNISQQQREAEADAWAARNVSPQAVRTAANWFGSGQGGSSIHGSPYQRAARVSHSFHGNSGVTSSPQRYYSSTPTVRVVRTTARPVVYSPRAYSVNAYSSSRVGTPQVVRIR